MAKETYKDRLKKAADVDIELFDINQKISASDHRAVAERVKFLLDREKMMPPGGHVIFPADGYESTIYPEGGWIFNGDFNVFDRSGRMIARGGALAFGKALEEPGKVIFDEIEVGIDPEEWWAPPKRS